MLCSAQTYLVNFIQVRIEHPIPVENALSSVYLTEQLKGKKVIGLKIRKVKSKYLRKCINPIDSSTKNGGLCVLKREQSAAGESILAFLDP